MASAGHPWFKMTPKDWRDDMGLACCSIAARGLWIELMNAMHLCEPYGHLCVNGKPMPSQAAAAQCRVNIDDYEALLQELEENGVFSRTEQDGIIFSRRMVRDELQRLKAAKNGERGGNPALRQQGVNPTLNPTLNPNLEVGVNQGVNLDSYTLNSLISSDPKTRDPGSAESVLRADALLSAILRWKPDHRLARCFTDGQRAGWAQDIERLHRIDGIDWDRIDAVIAWLPSCDFWATNIQSGTKLRAKFDRLEAEMRKPQQARPQQYLTADERRRERKRQEELELRAWADANPGTTVVIE